MGSTGQWGPGTGRPEGGKGVDVEADEGMGPPGTLSRVGSEVRFLPPPAAAREALVVKVDRSP